MMERKNVRTKEGKKMDCQPDRRTSNRAHWAHSFLLSFFPSLLLLSAAGCGSWASANKMQYMINPGQPQQVTSEQTKRVLEVDRFTIEAAFAVKSLIYRTGELQYQTDFYNEFLIPPALMITEETREWLSRSGLFARIVGPATRASPTHLLEGNIVDIYGDLRNKEAPAAVVQIRFFVSRFESEGHPVPIYGRDYSARSPIESRDPAGLVDAYSRCFQQILADLQKDLAEKLGNN
jgi:cholesterol transport system auxiliary component